VEPAAVGTATINRAGCWAFEGRVAVHFCVCREYSGMAYPAFITDFLRKTQLPRLSVQEPAPDKQLIQRVAEADDDEIASANGPEAKCIRSLLYLAAGGVDQAHRIVQEISTSDAAYIHGIIHRIDDDFDNARYWFRRAGMQPATAEMYRRAAANSLTVAGHPIWDPLLVTDMVETSRTAGVTQELRAILTIEFEVLLLFLSNRTEPGNLV
jgi:hypothetical protein